MYVWMTECWWWNENCSKFITKWINVTTWQTNELGNERGGAGVIVAVSIVSVVIQVDAFIAFGKLNL